MATKTSQEDGGGEERKGRRKTGSEGKPIFTVAPTEGRMRRRENSQGSLTPRSVEERKGEEPGSPLVSRGKEEGERRAKRALSSGITQQDESGRSSVSTLNTSTQGGSSSSRTRVVPHVVIVKSCDYSKLWLGVVWEKILCGI